MNDFRTVAVLQRRVVLAMGLAFLWGIIAAYPGWDPNKQTYLLLWVLGLGVGATIVILTLRLMRAIGLGQVAQWIAALLLFFPWVSTLVLLWINLKATKLLRSQGFHVGLLGVAAAELDRPSPEVCKDETAAKSPED